MIVSEAPREGLNETQENTPDGSTVLNGKKVEVEFENGSLYKLSAEYLRIYSPAVDSKIRSICGEKVISGRRHVGIMSAEPIGNYGVRLLFDDLHKTGIFTWDYFYHLGNISTTSSSYVIIRAAEFVNMLDEMKGTVNVASSILVQSHVADMMENSTCLMHAFSYASAIPNEVKQTLEWLFSFLADILGMELCIQGTSVHALGESISFGRFMSESLDWEKWSTFSSHKRYVEEAERYAKPGSVAQKKAFFEAHYKKIAAQKVAALLEQQDNQENPNYEISKNSSPDSVKPHVKANQEQVHENPKSSVLVADVEEREIEAPVEGPGTPEAMEKEPSNQVENGETQETVSGSEISETSHNEKPLLNMKSSSSKLDDDAASVTSKKKSTFSSFKSAVYSKKSKVPPSPARHNSPLDVDKENNFTPMTTNSNLDLTNEMRSTPKSLSKLINFTPAKEPHKIPPPPPPFIKKESSKVAPTSKEASKKCATPFETPMETSNGASNRPMTTPSSESRRIKTPTHPSASGSKIVGPRWNILSSVSKSFTAYRNKLQSPTLSTPFPLRTEERAARRKQASEKAGTDLRKKLQQSFCFKARPLPEFYKETETPKDHTKKTPVIQAQLPKRGRMPYPSSKQGLVSKPTSASLTKNDSCKYLRKKTS
ncbi:hypothetical protein RND71_032567 [Anisodus tanguticus]|uniref:Gamma-butyrobetaine hydroxylase-like N-terminal domain-containing protein n=1 Tax=Anisodus tanguticus TaxID=243964 RepID=A0AAE1R723_9SOLA|nr:hypothetical protein RND71_032567 [Anisodus tanguticus]